MPVSTVSSLPYVSKNAGINLMAEISLNFNLPLLLLFFQPTKSTRCLLKVLGGNNRSRSYKLFPRYSSNHHEISQIFSIHGILK